MLAKHSEAIGVIYDWGKKKKRCRRRGEKVIAGSKKMVQNPKAELTPKGRNQSKLILSATMEKKKEDKKGKDDLRKRKKKSSGKELEYI
ncbi:hypothetical protein CEXT_631891 [Caerostris extrusa]|uniref:Uncharacterized protein n=1 Tax=Caerostris extrusa TaxID=172846 RepID=A0AAV4T7Z3_CAEEX|nr:hypothetical protein CEXT_631891 [Caerostris extrusa]